MMSLLFLTVKIYRQSQKEEEEKKEGRGEGETERDSCADRPLAAVWLVVWLSACLSVHLQ